MEVRNDISQICELLKQEAQHSFFVEDDKERQSSPVILSRTNYVFMLLTGTTNSLHHSRLCCDTNACLFASFLFVQWIRQNLHFSFSKTLVNAEPCVMSAVLTGLMIYLGMLHPLS